MREALSCNNLTEDKQRKFSRRARQYALAYKALELAPLKNEKTLQPVTSHQLIEKIIKNCKTHRCASDFDHGYINEVVSETRLQGGTRLGVESTTTMVVVVQCVFVSEILK